MHIRDEEPRDTAAISRIITDAMKLLPQATGTEAAIVDRLRQDQALTLSLVAEHEGEIIGHLAASDAAIGTEGNWGLIGPLAVDPPWHRQGVGSALMAEAIRRLQASHRGVALVGDPAYYQRFGFRNFPGFGMAGLPPEVVQALPFGEGEPQGELFHHAAFGLEQQGQACADAVRVTILPGPAGEGDRPQGGGGAGRRPGAAVAYGDSLHSAGCACGPSTMLRMVPLPALRGGFARCYCVDAGCISPAGWRLRTSSSSPGRTAQGEISSTCCGLGFLLKG